MSADNVIIYFTAFYMKQEREILVSVKHTTQITLSATALHCESLIVQVHGMKELTQWVAQTS